MCCGRQGDVSGEIGVRDERVYGCGYVRSEAGFVDAIVDVIVCPIVGAFDFLLQMLRKEIDLLVLLRNDVVELGVEHA